jgi:hypothetical protein
MRYCRLESVIVRKQTPSRLRIADERSTDGTATTGATTGWCEATVRRLFSTLEGLLYVWTEFIGEDGFVLAITSTRNN